MRIASIAAFALGLVLPGIAPRAVPFEEIAPPVGPPTEGKTLTSNNDEISVLSRDQGLRINAVPLPDVHPTYLRFDDGSIRFWIQGGGGTSIFTTTDFKSFTPSPISGRVRHVLAPNKPQSSSPGMARPIHPRLTSWLAARVFGEPQLHAPQLGLP